MAGLKSWKSGTSGEPSYPTDFEVVKKAVLQVTDIKTNRNKYYAIELHKAGIKYRVFTHYGRTDDLDTNPNAGVRESRYGSEFECEATYKQIYNQKTGPRKGYKELSLASSRIGSSKSVGKSSGHVDTKTLEKIQAKEPIKENKPTICSEIQNLVSYIYDEATSALTSTVQATITANGIETPLGVLTLGQIDKGQEVLDELYKLFQKKAKKDKLIDLTGEFYTLIPHRIGRTREAIQNSIIDNLDAFTQKQDTLQLMRDMLSVNGDSQVLLNPEIEKKYQALECKIEKINSEKFNELKEYVEKSQIKTKKIRVKNIYSISRKGEEDNFNNKIKNHKLLFHGSRARNWVGILSRGLLLPKVVVSLGVHRTDAGWLGNGIYFGDAVCTTLYYTSPGKRGTRFMTIANVALGKMKDFNKITYGLNSPPEGYDSCHGVRGTGFADDEYVIYKQNQQKLQYLVEFTG